MKINAYVIKAGRTKRSPRKKWARLEYAQAAIVSVYPDLPPEDIGHSLLARKVNKQLSRDPKYHRGKISRQTVMRALALLRAANR
jgi:hypothetical protein